ncbi:MAG TPA: chemotaxis-specific protein-glutamate methyltransferase CheB [Blastocatellia bacterium]|nr:chemotaxis-specific protein-glutamate methyltransferase CheB [Blastocatellia bacterium]
MDRIVRALIVDDSAYVRKVVKQILSRSPGIEVVGTARDGIEALELVQQLNPDVITCDLNMPRMGGCAFVRELAVRGLVPTIIMSIESESGEEALAALDAGAVDFVQKPTALATEKIFEISEELISKVKAAADAPVARLRELPAGSPVDSSPTAVPQVGTTKVDVVLIGISTGGPQALKFLIPQLPAYLPVPVVIVMHMPVGYTEVYARKLDEISLLSVREASEGEDVKPGTVILARAGRHLTLRRGTDGRVLLHLGWSQDDTPHRPSVDVLFQSAAEVYGSRVLGLVMTGMGADGKQGAAWVKAQGGLIYTEAEETCVVYGMPRSVAESGLSDRSVPLDRMAQAIMETI